MPTPSDPVITIRELPAVPDAWQLLKHLRLAALREAGQYLWSRGGEEDWTPARWREELAGGHWFHAVAGPAPVGLMKLALHPDENPHWHIEGLWVAPDHRRHGLGRSMVDQAETFTRTQGETQLALWYFDDNHRAAAFYRDLGYEPTGRHGPLGTRTETELSKRL